jgi:hypothetical protein
MTCNAEQLYCFPNFCSVIYHTAVPVVNTKQHPVYDILMYIIARTPYWYICKILRKTCPYTMTTC